MMGDEFPTIAGTTLTALKKHSACCCSWEETY